MVGTAVTAALALGNAIYGGIKSAAERNKYVRLIQGARDRWDKWWDVKKNEDSTLRTDFQSSVNAQRELLNEQAKQSRARQVVAGGSEERAALEKEAANRSLSNTITDYASQASADKDNKERIYQSNIAALDQQEAQAHQQQAAQIAQAASQAVNAGISLTGQLAAEPNNVGKTLGVVNQGNAAAREALPKINTQGNIITDFTPNKEALLKAPAGEVILGKKNV